MNHLKRFLAVLSFALVATATRSYADPIVSLKAGATDLLLVKTTVAGVTQYAYNDTATNVLDTRTTTFLATYANVAGVDVLNVTDVCAQVNLFGGTPIACQALAFTFTDLAHTNASIINVLGIAGASVSGDVANINFATTVGAGSAQVNFTGSAPASTPEPGSLALLATGLCGVAGVIRRRIPGRS